MYKFDLAVYGHITIDRIINNFEEDVSLGAIAHFWNALNIINSKISYKLFEPININTKNIDTPELKIFKIDFIIVKINI